MALPAELDAGFTAAYFDQTGLYAFGRQPEAIHWDLVQLALSLSRSPIAEALTPALETFPDRFRHALRDAVFARLGVAPASSPTIWRWSRPSRRRWRRETVTIDRFFFDWRGGALRATYRRAMTARLSPSFAPASRAARRCPGRSTIPIGPTPSPARCTSRRSRRSGPRSTETDDWSPLHAKIAAVRRMGEAMRLTKSPPLRHEARVTATLTSIEPATGARIVDRRGRRSRRGGAAPRAPPGPAGPRSRSPSGSRRCAASPTSSAPKLEPFADLIARETGKPLWEARTEVEAVINKVDISVSAYAERTAQRRLEGAMGARVAVRHKPHGVLAVLGPYNFPAHLPNGHIVPALIAGNAVVFKPSEKTPAVGEFLVRLYHRGRRAGGRRRAASRAGRTIGKALAAHAGIDGLLFTGSARAGVALHRQFAETPQKILALEMGGNNPLVVWDAADIHAAAAIAVQSALYERRPALHRGAAADRPGRRPPAADRRRSPG